MGWQILSVHKWQLIVWVCHNYGHVAKTSVSSVTARFVWGIVTA